METENVCQMSDHTVMFIGGPKAVPCRTPIKERPHFPYLNIATCVQQAVGFPDKWVHNFGLLQTSFPCAFLTILQHRLPSKHGWHRLWMDVQALLDHVWDNVFTFSHTCYDLGGIFPRSTGVGWGSMQHEWAFRRISDSGLLSLSWSTESQYTCTQMVVSLTG